jgi:hypothetical protein
MAEHEQQEGRRRLIERDRDHDHGERRAEYEQGEWQQAQDPLARSRRQAMEENSRPGGDPQPGLNPQNEAWQREKQMIGQDADQPGKPRTWKRSDQAQRNPGAGDAAPAGRDGVSIPAGNTDDDGEDAGTDTSDVRRPLRRDELPDSGDVTQG